MSKGPPTGRDSGRDANSAICPKWFMAGELDWLRKRKVTKVTNAHLNTSFIICKWFLINDLHEFVPKVKPGKSL